MPEHVAVSPAALHQHLGPGGVVRGCGVSSQVLGSRALPEVDMLFGACMGGRYMEGRIQYKAWASDARRRLGATLDDGDIIIASSYS